MPVTETGWTLRDGRKAVSVRRSKRPLRGEDTRPHQAKDLHAALTDPNEQAMQSAQVKKPRELVEAMRVSGEDRLTAHDQAVYEMMLAVARDNGIDKDWHRLAIGDILKFLRVEHVDRVVESLDRIAGTLVTYDVKDSEFRKRGRFPLAIYEVTADLRSSTAVLEYMIPPPVRRLIQESGSYARLEIGAYPSFKSKYSARLYPRLALRAGYDAALRKPWSVEPRQLADELGYPYKTWNYRHFRRDCLDRVLEDVAAHVTRFQVSVEEVHGKGRGRPVESLVIRMSDLTKSLWEMPAAPIQPVEKYRLQALDESHQPNELPSAAVVSRAVTMTGRSPEELSKGWRAALDRAKAFRGGGPDAPGGQEAQLLYPLKHDGADVAFALWARTLGKNESLNMTRVLPPRPPSLSALVRRPTAPRPAAARAAVVVDDPFDYVPGPGEFTPDPEAELDDCPF